MAADVVKTKAAKMVQGQPIAISAEGALLNGSTLSQRYRRLLNGVTHVIDTVILPPQG
ncbi:MAG: hypothetical protein U0930_21590 [Pirellulales bacterium]